MACFFAKTSEVFLNYSHRSEDAAQVDLGGAGSLASILAGKQPHAMTINLLGQTKERELKLQLGVSVETRPLMHATIEVLRRTYGGIHKMGPPPRTKHERNVISGLIKVGEYKERATEDE